MCEGITGPLSKIYTEYGCNEGDLIVLALEGSWQPEESVQQFINHYNPSYPYIIGSDAIAGINATVKPTSVPTVRLIAPDRTIIKTVNSDIKAIETMLMNEGLSKSSCTNQIEITDTTDGGLNVVNSDGWYAAVDNEGVGSKVIKNATKENGSVVTKMHVGPFSYPNGPWTSGKLAGNIGYNINSYDYVKITYKSSIDLIFELPMPSLDSGGKNFGKRIDATDIYKTVILDLATFEKPTWAVSDATTLDKNKVSTISFRTLLANGEDVEISVKELVFYKRSDTDITKKILTDKPSVLIAQTKSNLCVDIEENLNASYRILSVNGRVLQTGDLQNKLIDCSKLSSGSYILNINSPDRITIFSGSFKWEK